MNRKNKTIDLRKARAEKRRKIYYFGYFLPLMDGLIDESNFSAK